MTDDRVVVGAVGKPFGVHGDVYVHPDPDLGHEFPVGQAYTTPRGPVTCARTRLHAGRRVVAFEGVEDREAAEELRGTVLTLDRSEIVLDEGAHWVADLEGAEVVDAEGELVGVVERVEDGPAHDFLLLARPDGGEALIPAVDEFIEVTADRIVLHPIPGLLDTDHASET